MEHYKNRIPVIHIGLPKTATTTLQWRLFACHSEIFYLGRYDGGIFKGKYRPYDACRDAQVQQVMQQIAYTNVYEPDFQQCEKILHRVLQPAFKNNLLPVWSWESYSTDIIEKRRARARNLKKLFGKARILMTLRNPVALIESAYFLHLRRDNAGGGARIGRPVTYYPINEWLQLEFNNEIIHYLQYADTLRAYVDEFGPENITVLLFEDLLKDRYTFYRTICEVMEINVEEGVRLMDQRVDNQRWTILQIEALQAIKGSFVQSLRFRFANRRKRRKMLFLKNISESQQDAPSARAEISEEWREKIYNFTHDGNCWIEDTFVNGRYKMSQKWS